MISENASEEWRRAASALAPVTQSTGQPGEYDLYPSFSLGAGKIKSGYPALARWVSFHRHIRLDGYIGVFWEQVRNELGSELEKLGLSVAWYNVSSAMLPEKIIDKLVHYFMKGDDPLFGTKCSLKLWYFFNSKLLGKIDYNDTYDISIAYGCGASLVDWVGPVAYIDLPKNELQFRSRAGSVSNLGKSASNDPKEMYRRFYFVDWPVLNRHKKDILPNIELIVDGQRPETPVVMSGYEFREGLRSISVGVFRVRPWFEPGPWGGTWLKKHIRKLNQDAQNYAWSFELIVPENGLFFESDNLLLEFSFDFLIFQEQNNILGKAAERFGDEFPIRFDFLDTFEGGNLSVQVHPTEKYIKKEFGESFTQDESYYIIDAGENATVNLGFVENIKPGKFRNELENSYKHNRPVEINRFVQSHPSCKHDLFLIPNQTIHGSGKDNLVLEISSTPYIFTFKMYDWLRPDLDGNPRSLNIERAFNNLDFSRKGKWVTENLIARPKIIDKGKDWQLVHLPTHPNHFYDVFRYEFDTILDVETENRCHVMMLVEGSSILVGTLGGKKYRYNYAETFIIPAACGSYHIINEGNERAMVVRAFVK